MSILDHAPLIRIFWDGRHGIAVGPTGRRVLTEKPVLGFRFAEMDYAPAVCCQVRREAWHAIDDMRPDEREACARYLGSMR
jgi:hypothetical protein